MKSFTIIEKYAIIKVLSHIMKADGIIHPKEERYMDKIYHDFSITVKEIEDIANIDDIQTKHIISEMSEEKKIMAKDLFIGMAKADGVIHPKETEVINQMLI